MSVLANTTYTYSTAGVLYENQTNASPETIEDTTSAALGNDTSKEVILAAEILNIITAGISLIGLLGELNVNLNE